MKKTSNKLSLNKITVAHLAPADLAKAVGGTVWSDAESCHCLQVGNIVSSGNKNGRLCGVL